MNEPSLLDDGLKLLIGMTLISVCLAAGCFKGIQVGRDQVQVEAIANGYATVEADGKVLKFKWKEKESK